MAWQNPWLTQVEYLGILVTQENQLQVQLHHLNAMVYDGLQLGAIRHHYDMDPSDGLVLEKQLLMALLTYLVILGLMLAGVNLALNLSVSRHLWVARFGSQHP